MFQKKSLNNSLKMKYHCENAHSFCLQFSRIAKLNDSANSIMMNYVL